MIINNNIPALNTHRQLESNNNAAQQSMEKLSSGLRINRAGDDAAGLAISEKMRGQISGLQQASRNAQDGISMIQTAEGALNESHEILQRMRELAVQSANDTNTEDDRAELQKEVDQLAEELTRIAETTEFNTQNLLDGTLEDNKFQIGANEGQNIDLAIADMRADALGVGALEELGSDDEINLGDGAVEAGQSYTIVELDEALEGESNPLDGHQYAMVNNDGEAVATSTDGAAYTILGEATALDGLESDTSTEDGVSTIDIGATSGTVTISEEYDAGEDNIVVDATVTTGIDITSQADADSAITTIDQAIADVSAQRSDLGAVQNRLEHTTNNLGTSAENLQAAESRIRDVDMAREMMEFTKNNILSQASQSMLAQANQMPQSVLQLLG